MFHIIYDTGYYYPTLYDYSILSGIFFILLYYFISLSKINLLNIQLNINLLQVQILLYIMYKYCSFIKFLNLFI